MRLINPKNKVLVFSLLLLFSFKNSYAQTERTEIKTLTPDEFTEMVLGEREIPSPSGLYQLERTGSTSTLAQSDSESAPEPKIISQNSSAEMLSPEARFAVGYLLFIKNSVSHLESLGETNSIRIFSNRYDTSIENAALVLDTIVTIENRHSKILDEIKSSNCLKFNESAEAGNYQIAVSEFIQDEKQLDVATTDYFREIDSELARDLPENVYTQFQEEISEISKGVNSLEVDPLGVIESFGGEFEYYSNRCQIRLNTIN